MPRTIFHLTKAVILLLFAAILIFSCKQQTKTAKKNWNMAYLYNPGNSRLHPECSVFHVNDSMSLLYVKLYTKELLFNQANPQGQMRSDVKLSYQMYENVEGVNNVPVTDSLSGNISILRDSTRNRYIASLPVKARRGKKYKLYITVTDLLRKEFNTQMLIIEKVSLFSAENFRVLSVGNRMPYFGNVVDTTDIFVVRYNRPEYKKIFIKFYKGDRPMPQPAFMEGTGGYSITKPDSIWVYNRIDSSIFRLKYKGMYQFQVDTSTNEGLTMLNLGGDYPRVNHVSQLVGPLAYLTTSEEMNEIQSSANKKLAVDNFWLKVVGNTETARELIRIYYNRVYLANYYFTSEREGWKTDRGMIYIIYGLPTTIEKTATKEIWKYYNKERASPINFVFKRQEIPFSNNNYVMDRNESFNVNWREAVESWREGKVYLLDED